MYFQPELKAAQSVSWYALLTFVLLFSVVSVFFIPIDIATIQMSLDPGFSIFFILVLIVFIVKIFCLMSFYMILFGTVNSSNNIMHLILQILGTLLIGGSFVIVTVEIYVLTKSFMAVIVHPFVIDFFLFFLCNIMSYLVMTQAPPVPFAYFAVPQQQPKAYQMIPMQPQVEQAPTIQYPEIPINFFPEQLSFESQMPQMSQMLQMPQMPKLSEAPKKPAYVPFYVLPQN